MKLGVNGSHLVASLKTFAYVTPSVFPVTFSVHVALAGQSFNATLAVAIQPPFMAAPEVVNATEAFPAGVEVYVKFADAKLVDDVFDPGAV